MFDVVTIGTATRDVFLTSSLFKVLRDPEHLKRIGFPSGEAECFAFGSKLEVQEPIFTVGGGAANTAVTFSREGFRTASFITLGNDERGNAITALLKEERVVPFAVINKKIGTAYSTILLSPSGERTILVYRGASNHMDTKQISFAKLKAKWAYIAPGGIDFKVIEKIINYCKRHGVKIAMNPSKHYIEKGAHGLKAFLKHLDVVIVNREEASRITGVDYHEDKEIFRIFDALVPGIAVMTDGPKGAMVSDGRYIYKAGIFKEKKIVDRTGAGDAFGAGFVAGLIQKSDIHHALRVASANATSVVEHIGSQAGILRKKDLHQRRFKYLDLDVEPL